MFFLLLLLLLFLSFCLVKEISTSVEGIISRVMSNRLLEPWSRVERDKVRQYRAGRCFLRDTRARRDRRRWRRRPGVHHAPSSDCWTCGWRSSANPRGTRAWRASSPPTGCWRPRGSRRRRRSNAQNDVGPPIADSPAAALPSSPPCKHYYKFIWRPNLFFYIIYYYYYLYYFFKKWIIDEWIMTFVTAIGLSVWAYSGH